MYAVYVLELVVTLGEGQIFFSVSFAPFISYRWGASVGVKWLWPSCELVIIIINLPLIGGEKNQKTQKCHVNLIQYIFEFSQFFCYWLCCCVNFGGTFSFSFSLNFCLYYCGLNLKSIKFQLKFAVVRVVPHLDQMDIIYLDRFPTSPISHIVLRGALDLDWISPPLEIFISFLFVGESINQFWSWKITCHGPGSLEQCLWDLRLFKFYFLFDISFFFVYFTMYFGFSLVTDFL